MTFTTVFTQNSTFVWDVTLGCGAFNGTDHSAVFVTARRLTATRLVDLVTQP